MKAKVDILKKPPTWRIVMSSSFSVVGHGPPPARWKHWFIKWWLGWRIEIITPQL